MSSKEIALRLDEGLCDALEHYLKDDTLRNRLERFLKQEAQREAARRFSVFRVTECGEQSCFLVEQPIGRHIAARSMRHYVSENIASDFRHYYAAARDITPEEYEQYVGERTEGTGRVVGAFDIDLDAATFASLDSGGWSQHTVRGVRTARKSRESA